MRLVGLGLLASFVFASPVLAADLATQPAEPMAPVALPFSWTGFYVGVHAGSLTQAGHLTIAPGADIDRAIDPDLSKTSFIGGALAGYNYQFNSVVLGAEADIGFTNAKSKVTGAKPGGDFEAWHSGNTLSQKVDGHVRARVGWAFDRLLVFAAGGLALSDGKVNVAGYCHDPGTDEVTYLGDASHNLVGFSLGAGVEYAFTDHLIARAEYLFDDYGHKRYPIPPAGQWQDRKVSLQTHTFRVALSYKF